LLNTFTDILTYLMRCNTECHQPLILDRNQVHSAYVTRHITKTPLKTHTMFEAIKTVFSRNSEFINGKLEPSEKTQKTHDPDVNTLTVQAEVGGPMACMYLWVILIITQVMNSDPFSGRLLCMKQQIMGETSDATMDKVILQKSQWVMSIWAIPVMDYLMWPTISKDMCLYDWIRLVTKMNMSKSEKSRIKYTSDLTMKWTWTP